MSRPLLEVGGLVKRYVPPRTRLFQAPAAVTAVAGVDLTVDAGRNFGIVGESGSGKSTLARLIMGLERPSAGTVRVLGKEVHALGRRDLKRLRRHFQMVFQDPYGSLDPRQRVGRIVAEPLAALTDIGKGQARERVAAALESVGLAAEDAGKYPHMFSGGQRQRIALARALITRPNLIVADEPVSALDVSVQAQVLNLLQDVRAEHGVTLVLISHDLAVVAHLCDVIAVMYRGAIIEEAAPDALFARPAHPYTRALIEAMPQMRPARPPGFAPRAGEAPASGCAYAHRCAHAATRCHAEAPTLRAVDSGHRAACHFAERIMKAAP